MESKIKSILLVPTDFTEVTENAAAMACIAAKSLNFKVTLLHVIDKNTKSELKKENKGIESVFYQLQEVANGLIKEYAVDVDIIAEEGDIFTTIAEVAQRLKVRLIYLGTHGKVGMQKITGSFAHKVITSSEVPTIVIQKKKFKDQFNKIVLPITSDSGPWEKTKWAAAIAKEFKSEIHIFHLPGDALDDVVTMITSHFKANDLKYVTQEADKSSNFTKQVIDYATAHDANLIMIMTNADKGFKEYLLGSYDEDIIFNTSQIPVLCINPRDFNWRKIVPV